MKPTDKKYLARHLRVEAGRERGLAREAVEPGSALSTTDNPRVIAHDTTAQAFDRLADRLEKS